MVRRLIVARSLGISMSWKSHKIPLSLSNHIVNCRQSSVVLLSFKIESWLLNEFPLPSSCEAVYLSVFDTRSALFRDSHPPRENKSPYLRSSSSSPYYHHYHPLREYDKFKSIHWGWRHSKWGLLWPVSRSFRWKEWQRNSRRIWLFHRILHLRSCVDKPRHCRAGK